MAGTEHTAGSLRKPGGPPTGSASGGLSLVEVLVVIAFLAVVSALSIPSIVGLVTSSSEETSRRNLNYLNGAVIAFNQANWELVLAADSGSDDELRIFDSLRYRDASNPAPGSPYLPPNATFEASSGSNTYRAQWNGRMFKIVPPGSNGAGLDIMKIMGNSVQPDPTSTPVPPAS